MVGSHNLAMSTGTGCEKAVWAIAFFEKGYIKIYPVVSGNLQVGGYNRVRGVLKIDSNGG